MAWSTIHFCLSFFINQGKQISRCSPIHLCLALDQVAVAAMIKSPVGRKSLILRRVGMMFVLAIGFTVSSWLSVKIGRHRVTGQGSLCWLYVHSGKPLWIVGISNKFIVDCLGEWCLALLLQYMMDCSIFSFQYCFWFVWFLVPWPDLRCKLCSCI